MSWIFISLSLFARETYYATKDAELFKRPSSSNVAVSDALTLYLVDRSSRSVVYFNEDGKSGVLARAGQGPDEVLKPSSINIVDGKIYVYDGMSRRVVIFDDAQQYLKTVGQPPGVLFFRKTVSGWIGLHGLYEQHLHQPLELLYWNHEMTQSETCHRWSPERKRISTRKITGNALPFSPAPDNSQLSLGPDGRYACVKVGRSLFLFHMQAPRLIEEIRPPGKPIPFDKGWGKQQLATLEKKMGQTSMKVVADYPDYFPHVLGVSITGENQLLVYKYTTPPFNEENPPLAYDLKGQPQEPGPLSPYQNQVMAIKGPWAFLLIKQQDSYAIVRVKRNRAVPYLEKNPLPPWTPDDY